VGDCSDSEIWGRVLSGDERAFGVVWDRHRDRVFRLLMSMGNPSADAEDLTAAVFLELWRRRAAVRFVDESALPWLIVTAQNVARNASRARRRYRRLLASIPPPEPASDPAEHVADGDDDRAVQLRAAIAHARPLEATLLVMTVLEGFSAREAAAALGITEAAAKMRLSRFRGRLRAGLTTQPIEEGGS
jgi:RNA polymerase sigma factor (sigma-70 family)